MLKCGFYEVDITPPLGCSIPGYFRVRRAENILERLYAKAAVISDGDTEIAILVLDQVSVEYNMWKSIVKRVKQFAEIPSDNLIICATHAHTAGPMPGRAGNGELEAKHIEMVALLAADAVTLAKKRMTDCTLHYACGKVDGYSFVRNYRMKDGSVRTNPSPEFIKSIVAPYSTPNTDFPMLFAEDVQGKLLGAITCFALHNDTVGGNSYCADWAGRLGTELKATYGEDFVTVCAAAPCGNINHVDYIGGSKHTYREIAEALAKEAERMSQMTENVEGRIRTISRTIKIKTRNYPKEEVDKLREFVASHEPPTPGTVNLSDPDSFATKYGYAERIIKAYDSLPPEKDIYLSVFLIGDVCFYAMPGEIFSQFREMIKANTPYQKHFVFSLASGSHYSYVPVKELEHTEIYEAAYGTATLNLSAGEDMVYALLDMVKELA